MGRGNPAAEVEEVVVLVVVVVVEIARLGWGCLVMRLASVAMLFLEISPLFLEISLFFRRRMISLPNGDRPIGRHL